MREIQAMLERGATVLRERLGAFRPRVALVLGSGLGKLVEAVETPVNVEFAAVPGLAKSTSRPDLGFFSFGRLAGVPVAVMAYRLHYYEGHDIADTVFPLRLLRKIGAEFLLLTNASGGIAPAFKPGDFMVIDDHIAFLMPSPLRGVNRDELGPRFPDMSAAYDAGVKEAIFRAARREGIPVQRGVYAQTPGPQFETPAEVRALRSWGADAVGMSTATETIAACHCGFRVGGVSCITNLAAGISPTPITSEEVVETAARVAPDFRRLLIAAVRELGKPEPGVSHA